WSDNDYKPIPPSSGMVSNVRVMNGDDLVHAGIAGGRPFTAQRVEIFDRSGVVLQRQIHAASAAPRAGGGDWLLKDVRIYDANMNVIRRLPEMAPLPGLTPNQLTLAKVEPTELPYWTLKKRIAELEAGRRPDDEARAGLAPQIHRAPAHVRMT